MVNIICLERDGLRQAEFRHRTNMNNRTIEKKIERQLPGNMENSTIKFHISSLKPKEKEGHTQKLIKITNDTHSKPNKQFLPKQVVVQLPYLDTATSTFTYFQF